MKIIIRDTNGGFYLRKYGIPYKGITVDVDIDRLSLPAGATCEVGQEFDFTEPKKYDRETQRLELVKGEIKVVTFKTEEDILKEKEKEKARQKIQEQKNILSSTDWAVVKCMEQSTTLKEKYPNIAKERKQARLEINRLEEELG